MCFILPPHMLKELAKNGTATDRGTAINSLGLSMRLKGRQEVMSSISLGTLSAGSETFDGLRRRISDAGNTDKIPGTLVLSEDDQTPSPDVAVNEAFHGAGLVYNFLKDAFKRNSIDDHGLRMDATVHYGTNYDNAFWEGRQMIYGDGDGRFFNRFTIDEAIILHESFHGVTQHEANLDYFDQPGALNESYSDVMALCGKHWKMMRDNWSFKNASWLIGEGLFTSAVKGRALRDASAPGTAYNDPVIGKDIQPGHMNAFVVTKDDDSGVHINSGIMNYMFFLTCEQLQDIPSWSGAGQIWYQTLLRLRRYSNFSDAAAMLVKVASELHGSGSREQVAVKSAAGAVGIAF